MADSEKKDLELIREAEEAFNRDGFEGVVPYLDPEIEFHEPPEQPAPRVFRGIEETREAWRVWSDAWAEQRSETREVVELGDGRYLSLTTQHFRARDGLEITQPNASLMTIRDGKLVRWQVFWEEATGRREAGLSS